MVEAQPASRGARPAYDVDLCVREQPRGRDDVGMRELPDALGRQGDLRHGEAGEVHGYGGRGRAGVCGQGGDQGLG